MDMVEKLEAFTRKLELFGLDLSSGRLLHTEERQAEGSDNFSTRSEYYSMPKDIIVFVHDPLTVHLGGELSSLAKKTIPSLDEAAIQTELIEFQTSSHFKSNFICHMCRKPQV